MGKVAFSEQGKEKRKFRFGTYAEFHFGYIKLSLLLRPPRDVSSRQLDI